jgi:hypothetical protein
MADCFVRNVKFCVEMDNKHTKLVCRVNYVILPLESEVEFCDFNFNFV